VKPDGHAWKFLASSSATLFCRNLHSSFVHCGPQPASLDGQTLYQHYKKQLVDGTMSVASFQKLEKGTLRVSCERIGGPHAFQAPQVEFEMGGAMFEFYAAMFRGEC
jgi:hypothetical protein